MQVEVPSSPDSATRGDIVVTVLEVGGDEWDGEWRRRNRLGSYNGTRAWSSGPWPKTPPLAASSTRETS